jgi:hypothetical protein
MYVRIYERICLYNVRNKKIVQIGANNLVLAPMPLTPTFLWQREIFGIFVGAESKDQISK